MANGGAHSQSPRFFFLVKHRTLNLMTARTRERHIPSNRTSFQALVVLTGPTTRRATYSLPTEPQLGVRLEAPLLRGTPGNVNHSISGRTPSVEALHWR